MPTVFRSAFYFSVFSSRKVAILYSISVPWTLQGSSVAGLE